MTKKQEKAIKVLEQYKRECIEEYKVELDDKDNIDQPRAFYLHQQIESVYIVLNMLKEKDAEINKYKRKNKELSNQLLKIYKEQDNYNARIEKKDKVIDLMAKYIADIDNEDICFEIENKHCDKNMDYGECEDCIKQYFERKVEKK